MGKDYSNKWLIEQLMSVQEEERSRISRDLHDSLSQELSMARMYLDTLKSLDHNSESYQKAILEMGNIISGAVNSVRDISHDLSPHLIEANILSKSIQTLVEKCQNNPELEVVFLCDKEISLATKKMELYVYRVVQEFIHNSVKHSEATTLTVELKKVQGQIRIFLSDNGKGFDISGQYNSIGLANIEMRMKAIGAKYEYFSIPNKGTDLKITIDEGSN